MKRVPAQIESPKSMELAIREAARNGEVVPVEFTAPPMFFDTVYIQNAIKHKVVKALEWFEGRMVSGEANAKDMDVQLKYLEFANLLGANQAQDPMEKYRLLGGEMQRTVRKTVSVTETLTEKGENGG